LQRYDTIIIGAGHNGLVCSAYLAQKGQRVLVLEAAETPGGLGRQREFHPGFHTSVAHSLSHFSQKVARDLKLASHGFDTLQKTLPTIGMSPDQEHVVLKGDSVSGVSSEDQRAYRDYTRLMHRFADSLEPFWLKAIPRVGHNSLSELLTFGHMGLNIRRLGKADMREFLRIMALPARDLMDEFFDCNVLKAMLSWDGLIGAKMAPRSPNSAVLALLYRLAGDSRGAHSIPRGGVNGLIEALCSAATASSVEIRCSAAVERIRIEGTSEGLAAKGVILKSGETIDADRVVSSADPRHTFLELTGVEYLDIGFTNRIRRLRCEGYVGKLHLALDGLPEFKGLNNPGGRMIIAPDLDALEFSFDDAKYGNCPDKPVLEAVIPSLQDSSMAPDGQHVLSAHVMYIPYSLKGGWSSQARSKVSERAIDVLAEYAPGIRQQIIYQEFLTPADLEQQYGVTGGHWHHVEFSMDQMLMMRPTYEAAQYRTPIPGLFLCGAGCHPAGDITGAAGHNAAFEILR
jgi:phytoene dehydrogenase-like protein